MISFLVESIENSLAPLFRVRVQVDTCEISEEEVTTDEELVDKVFSPNGYPMPIFDISEPWGGRYNFIREAKKVLKRNNHPRKQILLDLL